MRIKFRGPIGGGSGVTKMEWGAAFNQRLQAVSPWPEDIGF